MDCHGSRWPAAAWRIVALAFLLWAVGARLVLAADPQFPALSGRVVDEAGILSPATREHLADWLQQYEQDSKRQVVVATVKSLQGYPIEEFGYRLGRFWGIGEKGRNTGVILLVAPKERAVRIEVGYGLEGELTDAISRAIIEQDILPAFRQGDFDRGVTAGTAAILRTLGWQGAGATGAVKDTGGAAENSEGLAPIIFIILVFFFAILRHGRHGLWIVPIGQDVWGSRSRGAFPDGQRFSGGGGSFGGGGASGRW